MRVRCPNDELLAGKGLDAVQGKGNRKGIGAPRWLILTLVGAGLYALGTNGSFIRQAKSVLNRAKERASDLPEDLVGRVEQVTGATGSSQKKTSTTRSGSQRRRKTASTR
jgi:hypothetical protein